MVDIGKFHQCLECSAMFFAGTEADICPGCIEKRDAMPIAERKRKELCQGYAKRIAEIVKQFHSMDAEPVKLSLRCLGYNLEDRSTVISVDDFMCAIKAWPDDTEESLQMRLFYELENFYERISKI